VEEVTLSLKIMRQLESLLIHTEKSSMLKVSIKNIIVVFDLVFLFHFREHL